MTKKVCTHNGATEVLPGIWAGGIHDEQPKGTIRVSLLEESPPWKVSPIAKALLPDIPLPTEAFISINWGDGGAPPEGVADVLHYIWMKSHTSQSFFIHCHNGHGRTGTALAYLLYCAQPRNPDVVAYLRAHYCAKAVETPGQFQWLKSQGICTSEDPIYEM